jgi:hypothetical protein
MENNSESVQKICHNCLSPLPEDALYCPQCSQKYTTGRVPLKELIADFFNTQFNLDSKFFKAVFAIFQPGKLTIEYFNGKHVTYASPIRIFLLTAILFFAVASIETDGVNLEMNDEDLFAKAEEIKSIQLLDSISREVKDQFDHSQVNTALDSLLAGFENARRSGRDSITLSLKFSENIDDLNVAKKDIVELSLDELADKYGMDSFYERILFKQQIKAVKNGKSLLNYFVSKLPLMVLLMMPFLAVFLKLLYIRREFYYVEHLVFSFHCHAFVFLIATFLALLGDFLGGWIALFIIGIVVYLFVAMKRVYGQPFGKTLLKFIILSILYLALSLAFFILTLIISFVLF